MSFLTYHLHAEAVTGRLLQWTQYNGHPVQYMSIILIFGIQLLQCIQCIDGMFLGQEYISAFIKLNLIKQIIESHFYELKKEQN